MSQKSGRSRGRGRRPSASSQAGARTGSGSRQATVKLKTARGRTASSQRWLQRQLNDHYVAESKRLGYRSRAAFKLIEIDDRFGLLRKGQRVVDLGAAPGGWTQVAVQRVDAPSRGQVVGLDILDIEPIAGAELLKADFTEPDAPEALKARLGGPVDVVLSDMAASSTGHRNTDHLRIVMLAELALDFAFEVLAPDGAFVAKVFLGGSERDLLQPMRRAFRQVRHFKPPASRSESAETYVIATGFRGRPDEGGEDVSE